MNKLLASLVLIGMVLALPAALAQEADMADNSEGTYEQGESSGMSDSQTMAGMSGMAIALPTLAVAPRKTDAAPLRTKTPVFGQRREVGKSLTTSIQKETTGQSMKMSKKVGIFGQVMGARRSALTGTEGGKVVQGRARNDRGSPFSTGKRQWTGTARWTGVSKN